MNYFVLYSIYVLILSILMGLSTWKLFKKLDYNPIFAFIPFYNYSIVLKETKHPRWWVIFTYFPIVGVIMMSVFHLFLMEKFGKKSTTNKLLTVFLPFIYMAVANYSSKIEIEKEEDLLSVLTKKIIDFSTNKEMRKLSIENLNYISQLWIKGISYFQILESCTEKSISIEKRGKSKPIDMSDIISICDNGLGYETSMVLNAINNILEKLVGEELDVLTMLIKRLKYGLLLEKEINIYELGFSDRIVVQVIGQEINSVSKNQIRNEIKQKSARLEDKLSDFPSYYTQIINEM